MAELTDAYRARLVCQRWLDHTGGLLDSLTVPDSTARVNDIISTREQVTSRLDQWDLHLTTIERLVADLDIDQEVSNSFRYR